MHNLVFRRAYRENGDGSQPLVLLFYGRDVSAILGPAHQQRRPSLEAWYRRVHHRDRDAYRAAEHARSEARQGLHHRVPLQARAERRLPLGTRNSGSALRYRVGAPPVRQLHSRHHRAETCRGGAADERGALSCGGRGPDRIYPAFRPGPAPHLRQRRPLRAIAETPRGPARRRLPAGDAGGRAEHGPGAAPLVDPGTSRGQL